ncbi:MAG: type II toxin-antitoxin system VapC family toxin [Rhodomicrobium sp.]
MNLVIDASVATKWVLPDMPGEDDVEKAEAVLARLTSGSAPALQPIHWRSEVLAVVAHNARERMTEAFHLLLNIPISATEAVEVYERAAELSQLKHHHFDTLYHAVALENGATLITADDSYFAKAYRLGNIRLLTNFTAS